MISSPPRMAIKKAWQGNFFSFYHAFATIPPQITVTFSTPTPGFVNYPQD